MQALFCQCCCGHPTWKTLTQMLGSDGKTYFQDDRGGGMKSEVLRNIGGGVQEVLRWCYRGEGRVIFNQNLRYVI